MDARELWSEVDTEADGITVGNLSLHFGSYRVTVDGEPVPFTAREFDLLRALCLEAGRIILFETLAQEVLGASDRRAIRHLNVLVHRMRAKLSGLSPYVLETVRFRGYGLLCSPPRAIRALPRDGP